jgi:transcriptional regulator with GAF, ATPase, and Fis domain
MSIAAQTKILRVLQEGEFERVGGNDTVTIDVQLLANTYKDLQAMVKEGTYTNDSTT